MNLINIATIGLLTFSSLFFLSGSIGLLRFPDVYSRLHAPTKADNLGLGFLILALIIQSQSVFTSLKLLLIWILGLIMSACSGQLMAHYEYYKEKNKVSK